MTNQPNTNYQGANQIPPQQFGPPHGPPPPGGMPGSFGPHKANPSVVPAWVAIAAGVVGLINFIFLFLPWQTMKVADAYFFGASGTFSKSLAAFSDLGRTVFPATFILLTSLIVIAMGIVVVLNVLPKISRYLPITLIVSGAINIVMLIFVFTFLNVRGLIKNVIHTFGDEATSGLTSKEMDMGLEYAGFSNSFHIGVWFTLVLSLALIGIGIYAFIAVRKNLGMRARPAGMTPPSGGAMGSTSNPTGGPAPMPGAGPGPGAPGQFNPQNPQGSQGSQGEEPSH